MTNVDPLPTTVLSRKAVVYVRQSTQTQVQVNRKREPMTAYRRGLAYGMVLCVS